MIYHQYYNNIYPILYFGYIMAKIGHIRPLLGSSLDFNIQFLLFSQYWDHNKLSNQCYSSLKLFFYFSFYSILGLDFYISILFQFCNIFQFQFQFSSIRSIFLFLFYFYTASIFQFQFLFQS